MTPGRRPLAQGAVLEEISDEREAVAIARRLALVAENALLNGDLQRALTAMRDLSSSGGVGVTLASWSRSG